MGPRQFAADSAHRRSDGKALEPTGGAPAGESAAVVCGRAAVESCGPPARLLNRTGCGRRYRRRAIASGFAWLGCQVALASIDVVFHALVFLIDDHQWLSVRCHQLDLDLVILAVGAMTRCVGQTVLIP